MATCLRLRDAHHDADAVADYVAVALDIPETPRPASRFQKPAEPEPLDIPRKVKSDGHQHVIDVALPYLKQVMLDSDWCTAPPRNQVRESLFRVDMAGNRFWGANQMFTRKRTVEDLILQHYVDSVRARL